MKKKEGLLMFLWRSSNPPFCLGCHLLASSKDPSGSWLPHPPTSLSLPLWPSCHLTVGPLHMFSMAHTLPLFRALLRPPLSEHLASSKPLHICVIPALCIFSYCFKSHGMRLYTAVFAHGLLTGRQPPGIGALSCL